MITPDKTIRQELSNKSEPINVLYICLASLEILGCIVSAIVFHSVIFIGLSIF